MFITIILVIILFSFLIIAHEFGHFIVARRNGVQVDEFGIGFPPRLFGRKRGKTLYSINLLPLGGFVRLKGEDGEGEAVSSPDSFASQGTWVKTKILLAGVTMNLAIAYVIILGLLMVGIPPLLPGKLPTIGPIKPITTSAQLLVIGVEPGSLAAQSGLAKGDRLTSVAGESPATTQELREILSKHLGESITVVRTTNSETITRTVVLPKSASDKGVLGVSTLSESKQHYAWWAAPVAAVVVLFQLILATLASFGDLVRSLFTQAKVTEGVTGPIGVTVLFGEVFQYGWTYVLVLLASVSLSLAVINTLPLPALDGGRLALILARRAGVNIPERLEGVVHAVGFVSLILLMIVISITDIARLGR